MSIRQVQYGTTTSFDLTGLSSLSNGIGWISNKISIGSGAPLVGPDKLKITFKFAMGVVTQGQPVEFCWIEQDGGGYVTAANLTLTAAGQLTSTGGVLPTNMTASYLRDQLRQISLQNMSVSTTGTVYAGTFDVWSPGPAGALYVYDNSGGNLSAASLYYTTVIDIIQ